MSDVHEVRVFDQFSDPLAHAVERQAAQLGEELSLQTNRVFYVEGVSGADAETLARELLSDPARQSVDISRRDDWENGHVVEVSPLPGVTNPEAGSIMRGAKTLGISPIGVGSGTEYRFGGTPQDVVDTVVRTMLVNTTIEGVRLESPSSLKIEGTPGATETISIRDLNDDQLVELSKDRKLALGLSEMQAIREKARQEGRDIADGEIEYIAAAWSDHCCHKTTNAEIVKDGESRPSIFQRIKDCSKPYFGERGVLSAFGDNSGVFAFYGGQAINIKLETHNSPHNVEPSGGAATGTGGVLRDINETGGAGARPINSMHMSFIAPPNMLRSEIPAGALTPRQLLTGAVKGVGGYGNPMGIPTNNGSLHTNDKYRGKASILVGSMGIMPEKNADQGFPLAGDLVIAVGGLTGRDGIHGATFSSESADASTAKVHSGAVQIGDPITEKKMFDAILEAGEQGLIRAMTDCGAAGFASAIGELGEDIGVAVDLAKAPLKYEGLAPWEIFLSESQERGVLAVDPANLEALEAIFAKHESGATVLGTFGNEEAGVARLSVKYGEEQLVDLDYDFIKNGRGKEVWVAQWTEPDIEEKPPTGSSWEQAMSKVLSDWNICSKEPIVRRYDHEVQGSSALKPYGGVHNDAPNNAAVMTPILGKSYAVVQSHGCNPTLTELDPSRGSKWSYAEAMSNFVASGGNPDDAIIVNNYISASPTERVMGALDKSVDALAECVHEFRSPIISGKDSLSSTFKDSDGTIIESPYNLIITVAGKVPDVKKTISTDIKRTGSTLVLLGKSDYDSMGGSVYYDQFDGASAKVPDIDLPTFHSVCTTLHQAIQTGGVFAAHDVSEGGLATTVSEMLFGGDCGAELKIDSDVPLENVFFNETAGGFVVEVEDEEAAAALFGPIPYQIIGTTTQEKKLRVQYNSDNLPEIDVDALKSKWKQPLEEVFA